MHGVEWLETCIFLAFFASSASCPMSVDNPDQRMTADVETLTNAYGVIFCELILFPFVVSYYSYDAYTRAGWVRNLFS